MTAFYICAILFAPMLFMGMIPSAHAQDNVQEPIKDNSVSGPSKWCFDEDTRRGQLANRVQSLVSILERHTHVSVS